MAIDGPRGPLDDPRERRPDRRPDPFPRRGAGDVMREVDEDLDGPSDAERLVEATEDFTAQAAEQDRQRQADRDRQRQADLQRQRQQDQQRAEDDRQRAQDEQQRAQDEQQRQAEQEREAEQQAEQDRAREEDEDPAVDPASLAAPGVAAAAATAEAEREPNTLADRPTDSEAAQDPDAYRRWQEPGVVPTREELDQALNGDPDDLDAAGPAAAAHAGADPDGQPDRGQDGPEEDYVGRHRSEDAPEADLEAGNQHVFDDDQRPDPQHWAPPAAEARVDRDGDERPTPEQDREPDSQTRQGGAAPARDAANEQQSQRSGETGKTVAAGGLAAGGKVIGSADNLVEAASPTGRPAQSQNWGTGRHQKPGDQALRKVMAAAMSGNARASDAARAPERTPQAAPHSGAHTPGQFHQRMQQQHQRQNDQQRQQGS